MSVEMELHVSVLGSVMLVIGTAALAYLLGCVNGSILVSKYIFRDDIRTHGSGNAGLTNFYRTYGTKGVVGVLACDILKAMLAVIAGGVLFGSDLNVFLINLFSGGVSQEELAMLGKIWATIFVLLGHMYPITFQFKGGKGILSGGTIAIMIDWRVALVVWGGFLVLAIVTKWVSLGSCWAGLSFPFVSWFVYQDLIILLLAIVCGGLILWKHRGNIKRILKGEESKFSFHHKK